LNKVRAQLQALGAGDPELLFAYRRRIHIRLMQDERGTPVLRRKLKSLKLKEQKGSVRFVEKSCPKSALNWIALSHPLATLLRIPSWSTTNATENNKKSVVINSSPPLHCKN
jgi:hypothetical protein